jgi:hypothetical protein
MVSEACIRHGKLPLDAFCVSTLVVVVLLEFANEDETQLCFFAH